jgi:AcrR family transcriptional regulator
MAAMATTVAARGLADTTVGDVLATAGASRRTFYRLFGNRDECFLATWDAIRDDLLDMLRDEGPPALDEYLSRMLGHFAAWPDHARVLTFEILAVGPEGRKRHATLMEELAQRLRACELVAPAPGPPDGDEVVHALLGAAERLVQRRLLAREEDRLPALAPMLAAVLEKEL